MRLYQSLSSNVPGCLHQIIHDGIRREASGFVLAAVAGSNQDGTRAAVLAQIDVARLVADDERTLEVEAEIGRGPAGE